MFCAHTASWGNGVYIVKLWLQLWLCSFICQMPRYTLEKAKKTKIKTTCLPHRWCYCRIKVCMTPQDRYMPLFFISWVLCEVILYFWHIKLFPIEIIDCLYQFNVKYSGYLLFREDDPYKNSLNLKKKILSTPGFPESLISIMLHMPAIQVDFSHVVKTFSLI